MDSGIERRVEKLEEAIAAYRILEKDLNERVSQVTKQIEQLQRKNRQLEYGVGKAFTHLICLGRFVRLSNYALAHESSDVALSFEKCLSAEIKMYEKFALARGIAPDD